MQLGSVAGGAAQVLVQVLLRFPKYILDISNIQETDRLENELITHRNHKRGRGKKIWVADPIEKFRY